MKKLFVTTAAVLIALTALTACTDPKIICGSRYGTYGLLNKDDKKDPKIDYDVSVGNVIWSALLFETVIAPIYFLGFDLWEPVGPKPGTESCLK